MSDELTPSNKTNTPDTSADVSQDPATVQKLHQGFCLGNVIVEPDSGIIIRDGARYHLAPKAMEILLFLSSQQCQVVSREDILNFGWGEGGTTSTNVTHVISEIRHALGDHKECPTFIQTIPRRGYRMMLPAEDKPLTSLFNLAEDNEPVARKRKWSLTFSILKSSRLFKASVAYVIFSWVMLQVLSIVLPIFHAPQWALKLSTLLLIICFPVLISFHWFKELRKRRRSVAEQQRRTRFFYQQLAVDSLFVAIVLVVIYFLSTYLIAYIDLEQENESKKLAETIISKPLTNNAIAVMTFRMPPSVNREHDYLVNQIQDEMINIIANKPEFKVASLRATMGIKTNASINDIKDTLGVRYIVEGRAQIIKQQIVVEAQLIDTVSGFQVWGAKIEAQVDQGLDLYQKLSRKVINALHLLLPSHYEPSQSTNIPTKNFEAFDAYLQGKDKLSTSKSIATLVEAIAFLKQAVNADPNFIEASASLCQAYMEAYLLSSEISHYQNGVQVCEMTANVERTSVNSHWSLGKLYLTDGRLMQAEQELRKALSIDPESAPVLITLAGVLEQQKHFTQAEDVYQQALALEPTFWKNYYDYGRFLYNHGKYQQAIEQFKKSVLLKDDVAIVHNALGGTYYLLMDWENASVSWSKAMAIEPTGMLYSNLATSLFFNKQFDDAAELYQQSLKLSPEDDLMWANLGDAYKYSPTQHNRAKPSFEKALSLAKKQEIINPKDLSLQSQIGRYHSELGDCQAANSYRVNILEATVSDPYIYYYLALLSLNCRDIILAEQYLIKSIELGYPKPLILADPQFIAYKEQLSEVFN
ncbi:tetratricopeptide repeat protein [Thalassotalea sp. HSM 43]|uniref:tetratricopeptide repeat protein n=1 Tax=Thalassotalea sp. HSM 43 TaxID=2552945 RepID=UPI001080B243|nr:tetratricopeptide repeat protein [Thalassotalea sp. HSM 43]QBY05433.1 tetratricopeptide repeat protein [Thalassotalea sp. HSM 43]